MPGPISEGQKVHRDQKARRVHRDLRGLQAKPDLRDLQDRRVTPDHKAPREFKARKEIPGRMEPVSA